MLNVKNRFYKEKMKLQDFWRWHGDEVCLLAPLLIGSAVKIVQITSRKKTAKLQKDNKERYIYDRSEGHYWELKRPLRNDEWYYISKEKKLGRSYADILSELRILK